DEWLPGKLDLQRALLDARPDVLFCFTDMRGVYASGETRGRLTRYFAGRDFTGDFLGPPAPFSSIAPLPDGAADFPVHVGALYRAASDRLRLLRARILLANGRGAEAAKELESVEHPPRLYRALCSLPAPVVVLAARLLYLLRRAGVLARESR